MNSIFKQRLTTLHAPIYSVSCICYKPCVSLYLHKKSLILLDIITNRLQMEMNDD